MPYQVHFVRCFADEHIHLGMRVTSRAEVSHAVVKKYINLDKCDLLTVQQRLNSMLEARFTELREIIEKEKLRVIHTHRQPIYQNLMHEVSRFAMQKMLHHLQIVSDESCTGHFKKIYGLPCRHDIRKYQLLNTGLPLELVQQQWILRWPTQIKSKTAAMTICHLHVLGFYVR
jgi:hypothetical protein